MLVVVPGAVSGRVPKEITVTKQDEPLSQEDLKKVQGAGYQVTAQAASERGGDPSGQKPQQTRITEYPISPESKS